MNIAAVKSWVASIVIFGHLLVFFCGMMLGIFSLLSGIDAIQTILIACPVLSTTAFAAFGHVMSEIDEAPRNRVSRDVSKLFTIIVLVFPTLLLLAILSLFLLFWAQLDGFGPEQLKITLGALETFFGVYLGAISKKLFGTQTVMPPNNN